MEDRKIGQLHQRIPSSHPNVPTLKKYATLSPYLSEIQKRKKAKSVLRGNRKKNHHENSSKSFRIKEKSSTSLHDQSKTEYNRTIGNLVSKFTNQHKNRLKEKKANSVERSFYPSHQNTIENNKGLHTTKNNTAFQEMHVRVQNKHKRDNSFRKNMYEQKQRLEKNKATDKSREEFQISKYGSSAVVTGNTQSNRDAETIASQKKTQQIMARKNNFRKNKYEALYSSVTSNGIKEEKIHEPVKSENKFDFNKKQSNTSINKEMDQLAQKEMERFYRQLKNKEVNRSLQKSTQKYFKQENNNNYRFLKSNNDIQIFISTVKNPSIQKVSGSSTQNTMEKQTSTYAPAKHHVKKQNELLQYEFDFQHGEGYIMEMENPSEEESMSMMELSDFEKQRKQVEKQYFDKHEPNVEWSQDDCQVEFIE